MAGLLKVCTFLTGKQLSLYPPTFSTAATTFGIYVGIGGVVGMPLRTVGNFGLKRRRPHSPEDVLSESDSLQMAWIDAVPNTAEVVELQANRNWPNEMFVRPAVSSHVAPLQPEPPVTSVGVDGPLPYPTCGSAAHMRLKNLKRTRPTSRGFSVALNPGVVHVAHTTFARWLRTISDSARSIHMDANVAQPVVNCQSRTTDGRIS